MVDKTFYICKFCGKDYGENPDMWELVVHVNGHVKELQKEVEHYKKQYEDSEALADGCIDSYTLLEIEVYKLREAYWTEVGDNWNFRKEWYKCKKENARLLLQIKEMNDWLDNNLCYQCKKKLERGRYG